MRLKRLQKWLVLNDAAAIGENIDAEAHGLVLLSSNNHLLMNSAEIDYV